jgi:hypothetical protein
MDADYPGRERDGELARRPTHHHRCSPGETLPPLPPTSPRTRGEVISAAPQCANLVGFDGISRAMTGRA